MRSKSEGKNKIPSKDKISKNDRNVKEILKDKKYDPSTGQVQYPKIMGYHGTDDERGLNPEE